MNWKLENMKFVGIAFMKSTVRFPVFGHLTWVAKKHRATAFYSEMDSG